MEQKSTRVLDQGGMGGWQAWAERDWICDERAEAFQTYEVSKTSGVWRESQRSSCVHQWFAKIQITFHCVVLSLRGERFSRRSNPFDGASVAPRNDGKVEKSLQPLQGIVRWFSAIWARTGRLD